MADMEPEVFKRLMAGVPAPVMIVTVLTDGKAHGATVSSFASLSLDPPLISIALIEGSGPLGQIRASGRFGVNLLGYWQTDLALIFASKSVDRFAGVPWHLERGLPRFPGCASFAACDVHEEVKGGDHALLFGRVTYAHSSDEPPLVYTARQFGTHSKLIEDRSHTIGDVIVACAS